MNIEKNNDKIIDVEFVTIDNLPTVMITYEKVQMPASGTMQSPKLVRYTNTFTFSEYLGMISNGI